MSMWSFLTKGLFLIFWTFPVLLFLKWPITRTVPVTAWYPSSRVVWEVWRLALYICPTLPDQCLSAVLVVSWWVYHLSLELLPPFCCCCLILRLMEPYQQVVGSHRPPPLPRRSRWGLSKPLYPIRAKKFIIKSASYKTSNVMDNNNNNNNNNKTAAATTKKQ